MTWLSWRLQRLEAIVTAALLAALALLLIPIGIHMSGVFDHYGLSACIGRQSPTCGALLESFQGRFGSVVKLLDWFQFVPGIVGALIAVPLVLDIERGTFRLAWTQSVPRGRWLATRLAMIAASAAVASLIVTVLLVWWRHPVDRLEGRMEPSAFSVEGVVPFAYTLFAAALMLALGVALRRAAPAIAITLVGFLAVRLLFVQLVRPHLAAPVVKLWALGSPGPRLTRDWVLSQQPVDRAGHALDPGVIFKLCAQGAHASYRIGPQTAARVQGIATSCLAQHGIQQRAVLQPASRFWTFQLLEAAIFIGIAAALAGGAAWWIARRLS